MPSNYAKDHKDLADVRRRGLAALRRFTRPTTPWKQRRRSDIEDQVCNSAGIPVNAPQTEKNLKINKTDPTRSAPLVTSKDSVHTDPSPPCESSDGAPVLKEP